MSLDSPPAGNENELATKEALDRIFQKLFQDIKAIDKLPEEIFETIINTLMNQAAEALIPILGENGIELIKLRGLELAIPVAYVNNRPEAVVRLHIYKKPPFSQLTIEIQARISLTASEESPKDEHNWYVGENCFGLMPMDFPTSDSLATTEGQKKAIRAIERFDIARLSNGRFYESRLKSKVSPTDVVERLRIALHIFERHYPR